MLEIAVSVAALIALESRNRFAPHASRLSLGVKGDERSMSQASLFRIMRCLGVAQWKVAT
jgi:hypothetical protein